MAEIKKKKPVPASTRSATRPVQPARPSTKPAAKAVARPAPMPAPGPVQRQAVRPVPRQVPRPVQRAPARPAVKQSPRPVARPVQKAPVRAATKPVARSVQQKAPVRSSKPAAPAQKVKIVPKPSASQRPLGVTVVAILELLGSVFALVAGLSLILLSPILEVSLLTAAGILAIVAGVIGFATFYFLWKMKKLGFMLVMVVGALSIVGSLLALTTADIVNVALWIAILGYMWTKRKLFG